MFPLESCLSNCHSKDPLDAMLMGERLVRSDRIDEGIQYLEYAKHTFMQGISGRKTDLPELFLLVEHCYLMMMSATFGFDSLCNYQIFNERKRFHETYDVQDKIKGVEMPGGYVFMTR
jgi:hypothetical protein